MQERGLIAIGAFCAAAVFFGCAVFTVTLGGVSLIPAGLFSLSIGLLARG